MGYFEVLKLPLKTFWSLNRQVNRLRAEAEQRLLAVYGAAQSPDGYKSRMEALGAEIENPAIVERGFDEAAFQRLRQKFSRTE